MVRIKKITAREILDSRGYPTVAADVLLDDQTTGTASVPSGASTGSHEALELRDGGARYKGKGVLKAVANVEKISARLAGLNPFEVREIDNQMLALDGKQITPGGQRHAGRIHGRFACRRKQRPPSVIRAYPRGLRTKRKRFPVADPDA